MSTRIFVSYNFNDREIAHTVRNFSQTFGGKVDGTFALVENNVSASGERAIDDEIRRIMQGCDAALFIVGNNNHNSPWILREAELAISMNLHLVLTRIPESTGAIPPILSRMSLPVAKWEVQDIADRLNAHQRRRPW